jgi:arylsulfatase A-like enzyme
MAALLTGPRAVGVERVAAATPGRPNVLVILTDDQRLGTMQAMPATRRWFGERGVRYSNGFATTPLCCPARAGLFTGQYAHNNGVQTNGDAHLLDQEETLQAYLQAEGYLTALSGEYLTKWPMQNSPPYFDRFAMLDPAGWQAYIRPTFSFDGDVRTIDGYSTDVIGRRAVQFLRDFDVDDDRPWLLYVTPHAPHNTPIPAPRHADAPVSKWRPAPSVFELDRTDKPLIVRSQRASLRKTEDRRVRMLRTLMSVDDLVNRLMNELRRLGETTQTMAFFLSDNGFLWAEHGWSQGKRVPYVESIRVPYFMRWPGHIEPGFTQSRFVTNIDIAPTVMDVLGLSPTTPMDGRSLMEPDARTRVHTEYYLHVGVPPWASTWTPGYQYVEWYDPVTGERTFREYYNLVRDPYQMRNLLQDGDPQSGPPPERLALLEAQLQADFNCVGSVCP